LYLIMLNPRSLYVAELLSLTAYLTWQQLHVQHRRVPYAYFNVVLQRCLRQYFTTKWFHATGVD
jgi:hypothetical protein